MRRVPGRDIECNLLSGAWDFKAWLEPLATTVGGLTITDKEPAVNHCLRIVPRCHLPEYEGHKTWVIEKDRGGWDLKKKQNHKEKTEIQSSASSGCGRRNLGTAAAWCHPAVQVWHEQQRALATTTVALALCPVGCSSGPNRSNVCLSSKLPESWGAETFPEDCQCDWAATLGNAWWQQLLERPLWSQWTSWFSVSCEAGAIYSPAAWGGIADCARRSGLEGFRSRTAKRSFC